MDIGNVLVQVLSSLFPYGDIVDAWGRYLSYKAEIRAIEAEEKVLLKKIEQARVEIEYRLQYLKNQREYFDYHMQLIEDKLSHFVLYHDEIMLMLTETRKKYTNSTGKESLDYSDKYLQLLDYRSKESASAFQLLSTAIESQLKAIESIDDVPQIVDRKLLEME